MITDSRIIFLTLLTTFFFNWSGLHAQAEKDNPKIGFVFSGGGAKGIAEIGALTVLEREGIIPDYITGTSIGSIVGGLYAIGYNAQQLENLATNTNWESYFNDDLQRNYLPIEERKDASRYLLSFPVDSNKIQLPKGFVKGNKIGLLLSRLTLPVHHINNFDDFKIPFRCIAADFETGEAKVFKSGDLADAMRASMSIPSVFEPQNIGGDLYVDGGIIRNLPVEDVIEMGADIVVAIDIEGELYKKEELKSILDVLEQSSSYRVYDSKAKQLKMADVVIKPPLKGFGVLDFKNVDSLLNLGKAAAEDALPKIKRFLKNKQSISKQQPALPVVNEVLVNDLQIFTQSETLEKTISKILQIKTPETYKIDQIEDKIKRLLATKFITSATYRLVPKGEAYILSVITESNSGNFVRVGANYDSSLGPALLLNTTVRNALVSGSKFTLDARVSENPALLMDYIMYTRNRPNIGLKFSGMVHFYPFLFYSSSILLQEYENRHYNIRLDLTSSLSYQFNTSIGIGIDRISQNEAFFDPDTEEVRLNQVNLFAAVHRDTYDRYHFPRKGSFLQIEGHYSIGGNLLKKSLDQKFELNSLNLMARFQYRKVIPFGKRFVVHWFNDAGISKYSESNLLQLFYLGRQIPYEMNTINFYGLDYMEFPAHTYAMTGVKFRVEPEDDVFGSLVFNYGYFDLSDFEDEQINMIPDEDRKGNIFGAGLEIGAKTILGPALLSAEYNFENNSINFAFHLGYEF